MVLDPHLMIRSIAVSLLRYPPCWWLRWWPSSSHRIGESTRFWNRSSHLPETQEAIEHGWKLAYSSIMDMMLVPRSNDTSRGGPSPELSHDRSWLHLDPLEPNADRIVYQFMSGTIHQGYANFISIPKVINRLNKMKDPHVHDSTSWWSYHWPSVVVEFTLIWHSTTTWWPGR